MLSAQTIRRPSPASPGCSAWSRSARARSPRRERRAWIRWLCCAINSRRRTRERRAGDGRATAEPERPKQQNCCRIPSEGVHSQASAGWSRGGAMRGKFRALGLWACLALAATTSAQEGHPLVGSWHGDWGAGAAGRQDLTVVFDYTPDGADVTGLANPGYDHATLQNIQLTIP